MQLKFTYGLIALLVAVFAVELAFPIDALAFSPADFAARPWSALTAIFAHADLEHLAANLVVLWFFGLAIEREIGRKKALLLFLAGGFAGEFASAMLYPPDVLSLGASGGIFALIGAAMLVRPFELEVGRGWTGWPMIAPMPLIFLAAVYIVYNTIGIFAGPSDIAYGAHFAGLAVGLAFGGYYRRKQFRTPPKPF